MDFKIEGQLVHITERTITPSRITIANGKIHSIEPLENPSSHLPFITPGFIDAHVHIESSMLVPSEFARLAVVHGTVATISDPHEIANVCGLDGVDFMIRNGKKVSFKFNFGAPSCVPATIFETAGAALTSEDVALLLKRKDIKYLSEMMNFPGVLMKDPEVMKKIEAAEKVNKPVDGHAPGLRGNDAAAYIAAGISTDHECFTIEEARDKLKYGMRIIIREGSAAKNFDALIDLLHDYAGMIMFCSDDKHPDSLVEGHINHLCARAVHRGHDIFHVLQAACVNPVLHYKLDIGLLQKGDPADFILLKDLEKFQVLETYVDGECVAKNGKTLIKSVEDSHVPNHFACERKHATDFEVSAQSQNEIPVIVPADGQLITEKMMWKPKIENDVIVSEPEKDIQKLVVVNRYHEAPVAKSFITGFGFHHAAIASSVAHDSHNIVATGTDDNLIAKAINLIIGHKGGISLVKDNFEMVIPLPVAGLMSHEDGYHIAQQYKIIDEAAKKAGCKLGSPFMTLSFMALLVIPHLKLSDKGLFDGDSFQFVN